MDDRGADLGHNVTLRKSMATISVHPALYLFTKDVQLLYRIWKCIHLTNIGFIPHGLTVLDIRTRAVWVKISKHSKIIPMAKNVVAFLQKPFWRLTPNIYKEQWKRITKNDLSNADEAKNKTRQSSNLYRFSRFVQPFLVSNDIDRLSLPSGNKNGTFLLVESRYRLYQDQERILLSKVLQTHCYQLSSFCIQELCTILLTHFWGLHLAVRTVAALYIF